MFLAMLFAAAAGSFAATPERAALRAVGFVSQPKVVRVNRAGRFATVLTRGGLMESQPVREPIFVERFTRGWQALSTIYSQCDLRQMRTLVGDADATRLMSRMPAPTPDRASCVAIGDSGSAADVVAVRAQMRGPLIPYVLVSRDWALGEWYGAGGGSSLFRRTGTRWTLVAGGGGSLDIDILRRHGVPLADACRFRQGLANRPGDVRICGSR